MPISYHTLHFSVLCVLTYLHIRQADTLISLKHDNACSSRRDGLCQRCDGVPQCFDLSDEAGCTNTSFKFIPIQEAALQTCKNCFKGFPEPPPLPPFSLCDGKRPTSTHSITSFTTRPTTPATTTPAPSATTRLTTPVTRRPTTPVIRRPTTPVTRRPTTPVTRRPTTPVTRRPTTPFPTRPTIPVTTFDSVTTQPTIQTTYSTVTQYTRKTWPSRPTTRARPTWNWPYIRTSTPTPYWPTTHRKPTTTTHSDLFMRRFRLCGSRCYNYESVLCCLNCLFDAKGCRYCHHCTLGAPATVPAQMAPATVTNSLFNLRPAQLFPTFPPTTRPPVLYTNLAGVYDNSYSNELNDQTLLSYYWLLYNT